MPISKLIISSIFLVILSACSPGGLPPGAAGPALTAPGLATSAALSATDVNEFIDPAAAALLSDKEKAEAASAQFYALQFGRPGAPRQWQGDQGSAGKVTVGPYVRVNDLDCREFSHEISTAKGLYRRAGIACRAPSGTWKVARLF